MFATAVRFLAQKAKGNRHKPANLNIGLEGQKWSEPLRQIVKDNGPLTAASFWEHAQSTGLRSKKHMKFVLKWMRGQNHVKLVCSHLGDQRSPTKKEFLYVYVAPRSKRHAAKESWTTSGDENDTWLPGDVPTSSVEDLSPHQI